MNSGPTIYGVFHVAASSIWPCRRQRARGESPPSERFVLLPPKNERRSNRHRSSTSPAQQAAHRKRSVPLILLAERIILHFGESNSAAAPGNEGLPALLARRPLADMPISRLENTALVPCSLRCSYSAALHSSLSRRRLHSVSAGCLRRLCRQASTNSTRRRRARLEVASRHRKGDAEVCKCVLGPCASPEQTAHIFCVLTCTKVRLAPPSGRHQI